MKPIIVITMAGQGQRFRNAGYSVPKYEIVVHGQTLFYWALFSLKQFIDLGSQVVFIARKEFQPLEFIEKESSKLGIHRSDILLIDELTDGQATTVLQAKDILDTTSEPIMVYNIDTYVEPEYLPPKLMRGDAWIPCFEGKGDAWSFVKIDKNEHAIEVREKNRISPYATIGLYTFPSFRKYEQIYQNYYAQPTNLECKERYIAPLYNLLIEQGGQVFISNIPGQAVHPLGTPEEVEMFQHADYRVPIT